MDEASDETLDGIKEMQQGVNFTYRHTDTSRYIESLIPSYNYFLSVICDAHNVLPLINTNFNEKM